MVRLAKSSGKIYSIGNLLLNKISKSTETSDHFLFIKSERRLFTKFHRQLFCWIDKWHGLTMADIRRIEDETQAELNKVFKRF